MPTPNDFDKLELSKKLADTYEWGEIHFIGKRNFKYEPTSDVILITKANSEFGFSISINQNKKLNKPFAYFNLIKLNNFNHFEKVIAVGKPVDLSTKDYEIIIIQQLANILNLF